MSVYVDPMRPCIPNRNWRYTSNCHLFADSVEELAEFAQQLKLRPEWLQKDSILPHFDLTVGMRQKAIKLGAREATMQETAAFLRGRKAV